MEKFIMAGSTALRYRDIGKGDKVILLIHGYLGAIEVWDEFSGQLGKDFRVIAFDVPGHGISEVLGDIHPLDKMAQIAVDLLKKLSINKVSLVGHSMGGYIALEFARQFPEMVDKLILFHSHPDSDTEQRSQDREREIKIIEGGRKELITTQHPVRMFAPDNKKRFVPVMDEISEQAMLTEDAGMIALLRGMGKRADLNSILPGAPFKTMFIFGRHDQILTEEKANSVIAKNPEAKVVWLEKSGHLGFVEEAATSLKVVKEFVLS